MGLRRHPVWRQSLTAKATTAQWTRPLGSTCAPPSGVRTSLPVTGRRRDPNAHTRCSPAQAPPPTPTPTSTSVRDHASLPTVQRNFTLASNPNSLTAPPPTNLVYCEHCANPIQFEVSAGMEIQNSVRSRHDASRFAHPPLTRRRFGTGNSKPR